jgi:hypothetical protein
MGDTWLQRLVVRGPTAEVRRFRRAAQGRAPTRYLTVKRHLRTQRLSFIVLRALLPRVSARAIGEVEEPWDLAIDPLRRHDDGTLELTYKFQQSAFECDSLITEVSKLYPALCFVIACVAPSTDSQYSTLVHGGRTWAWTLPDRRKRAIWADVPESTGENGDAVFQALVKADWQMMDTVASHWDRKAAQLLASGARRPRRAGHHPNPLASRTRPSSRTQR